jgi:hypothetical protein
VIPAQALTPKGSKSVRLYPEGKTQGIGAFYENYREAWHLAEEGEGPLRLDKDAKNGPSGTGAKDRQPTTALLPPPGLQHLALIERPDGETLHRGRHVLADFK